MRLRRILTGLLAALTATIAFTAVAEPAFAQPSACASRDYDSGRIVYLDNDNNGGGAFVTATVCYEQDGFGYYDTWVGWDVTDTAANGAGATIRMEWTGTDGKVHYDVPPSSQRAWTAWDTASGTWSRQNIEKLYVRACLTNTNSEGHHCGAKW